MKEFSGKTTLVTGGSRGVGAAIALEFARRGANIGLVYRTRTDLAGVVAKEIEDTGAKVLSLQADVADASAAANTVAQTIEEFGSLDILAHSAGAPVNWTAVRDHDAGEWSELSTAEQKRPPWRSKKGPPGGCGLVPVVHGRAPRATRRALNRLTRRCAREGPVGPRGQARAGWSVQLAVGV